MTKVRPIVTRSAEELASLLGLNDEDARWMQVRAQLLARIVQEVRALDLTHAAAAERCSTSRSRLTAILNGNIKGVSTDLLLRIAGRLGLQTRISFARAA
jgi:predicted XRE-type DNA-binding protein